MKVSKKHARFFSNKTILISGGSEGLGKELVLKFLKTGAQVATFSRDSEKIKSLKRACQKNKNLWIGKADVQKEEDCQRVVEETLRHFKKLDILINNAGVSMRAPFLKSPISTIENIMDINFLGAARLTKFSLSSIIKTQGYICAVSSVAGLRGVPGRTGYSASKFALHGFMESLRVEMIPHKVKVLWFSPGFFSSNIRQVAYLEEGGTPQSIRNEKKMITASTCASLILKSIFKNKRHTVITSFGKLTYFLNRFFPSVTDKLTYCFYFKKGTLIK